MNKDDDKDYEKFWGQKPNYKPTLGEKLSDFYKNHKIISVLVLSFIVTYPMTSCVDRMQRNSDIRQSQIASVESEEKFFYLNNEKPPEAQLLSSNKVQTAEGQIKRTQMKIELRKIDSGTEAKLRISIGRLPCWDEEQYCSISVNGQRFSLKKDEGFQVVKVEDSDKFIEAIKDTNSTIQIPITMHPIRDAAFVGDVEFSFSSNGLKF